MYSPSIWMNWAWVAFLPLGRGSVCLLACVPECSPVVCSPFALWVCVFEWMGRGRAHVTFRCSSLLNPSLLMSCRLLIGWVGRRHKRPLLASCHENPSLRMFFLFSLDWPDLALFYTFLQCNYQHRLMTKPHSFFQPIVKQSCAPLGSSLGALYLQCILSVLFVNKL